MMQHMNKAVNDVRLAEHRELTAQGDDTLAGTRWLWLYGQENLPEKQRPVFDALKTANLRTARAWVLGFMHKQLPTNWRNKHKMHEGWPHGILR
jgi:transposase